MTHHRQIRQHAFDVVPGPTGLSARWAGRIVFDRPTFDVGEFLGDREPQLDSSADGVGDKARRLRHGSCGVDDNGVGTFIVTSQGPPTPQASPDQGRTQLMHSRSGRATYPEQLSRCYTAKEEIA